MKKPVFLRIYRDGQLVGVKQFEKDQISFGRSESVDVHLDAEEVSPIHAVIDERDTGYFLCDLGSESGTRKNEQTVLDDRVESGEEIHIGPFSILFHVGIPKPKAPPAALSEELDAASVKRSSQKMKDAEEAKAGSLTQDGLAKVVVPKDIESVTRDAEVGEKGVSTQKGKVIGTFAPPSAFDDLNKVIKPGKGPVVEVIVAWRERVIESRHFAGHKVITIGSHEGCNIILPAVEGGKNRRPFLKLLGNRALVYFTTEMRGDFFEGDVRTSLQDLERMGKLGRAGSHYTLELGQGEMVRIDLHWDMISVFVRFVSDCPRVVPAPLLDFTPSELASVVIAFLFSLILGFYVSVYTPDVEEKEDEPERIAKFIMNPPRTRYVVKQRVEVSDRQAAPTAKSEEPKPDAKPGKSAPKVENQKPGMASQMRPKPGKKTTISSMKQGGSKKTSTTEGFNKPAVTPKKDVSEFGLLSVLGNKGIRSQIDKSATGSGDLVGLSDTKTGKAGFAEDRAGSDVGYRIKDVGKGGTGTASVGVSDIKTKGSGGLGLEGSGLGGGLGSKENVTIEAGGEEEDFVGSIDREAVRRVVRKRLKELQFCYVRALKGRSNLQGKVVFEWVIGDQGRVVDVKVKNSNLGHSGAEKCMEDRLKNWRFPSPPANMEAVVVYPFLFMTNK